MSPTSDGKHREAAVRAAEQFVTREYQELIHGAGLLGGVGAQGRCVRLTARLRRADRMDRHCWRELRWLRDLFCLQIGDDPEAPGAAHFCALSPDDPAVHDLCLLAEALGDLLAEIDSVQTQVVSEEKDNAGRDAA